MHYLQLKYQGEAINPYLEIESGRIYVVPGTANANEIHTYYFSPIPFIERYPFEESLNPNMTTNLPRRIIERINE